MNSFFVVTTEDRMQGYEEEREILRQVDAKFTVHDCQDGADIVEVVREADAVMLNLHKFDSVIIEQMKRCQVISRYGVGFDNVDLAAATAKGIWVANVPDYGAQEPVADHALALLLACVRKIPYRDSRIRKGRWNLSKEQRCYKIEDKVLGLIGYGKIGRRMHGKCSGLGLQKVLVNDPFVDPGEIEANGGVPAGIDALLQESDYVSLHVPLTEQTRNLIDNRELSMMKNGAILVNTSRGPVVNESALARAIEEGRISSAGIDVFAHEPPGSENPLLYLDNVILSDHCGFYSEETIRELQRKTAQNVAEVLKGNPPLHPVNQLGQ
jgi:D-3-phosphoglycerate dehydrogenase